MAIVNSYCWSLLVGLDRFSLWGFFFSVVVAVCGMTLSDVLSGGNDFSGVGAHYANSPNAPAWAVRIMRPARNLALPNRGTSLLSHP